jgi:hypothetical protein
VEKEGKMSVEKTRLGALLIIATIVATTFTIGIMIPCSASSTEHENNSHPTRDLTTAPPQTEWNKTYGRTGYDNQAHSVKQTSDGGYIVAGYTYFSGAGGCDFWLVKTDSSGNQQWNKTYGGTGASVAWSVEQTSDGGYIVAGYTYSSGTGWDDFWLVKTDSSGKEQWNRTYGGTGENVAQSVKQTSDGGYIVAGYTISFDLSKAVFLLVKTDSSGNQQWNRTYGGTAHDEGYSVLQTSDGGYIVAGYTESFGAGRGDAWLVKTDSSGNEQWNKTYGGAKPDWAQSVQQTSDGGYILAGTTYSYGGIFYHLWLVKTDSSGNEQWNKTYGGIDYQDGNSVQQTTDGGYIVAGDSGPSGSYRENMWILKADSAGNEQWNKTYGGTSGARAYSVEQTSDGGYIVAGVFGYSNSGVYGNFFWLVKIAGGGTGQGIPLILIEGGVAIAAVVVVLGVLVFMKKRKGV